MSVTSADMSMTRLKATPKTASILELHLKNFLQTGIAPNAVRVKTPSQNNKSQKTGLLSKKRLCDFRKAFDTLYEKYNRIEYLKPDPVQFLFDYQTIADREIIALIASSLAYGRVTQIIKSIKNACSGLGKNPAGFILKNSDKDIKEIFNGFKHRFTTGKDLANLLIFAKIAIRKYGSLEETFAHFLSKTDYISALDSFAKVLNGGREKANYLIPRPSSGSTCKRLNLMIKWLSRKDEIDPGGWTKIPKSQLIIPLDTHMWQIAIYLGFTKRKSPDLKAALEITDAFRKINPDDPCKYDFALTRLGIRNTKQLRNSVIAKF